jgi:putative tryptophan/tyrosine transport system substrate-binding protein
MNTRRKLVIAPGAGALTAPFSSFAQPRDKVWRVGFLSTGRRPDTLDTHHFGAFPQGMRELGYIEGKTLFIDWRYAESMLDRLPALAAELAQLKPDVIVVGGPDATRAAQKTTTTIPIVMASVSDPVGSGFITSLAHPGGNITGSTSLTIDLGPKRLEMLLAMVPRVSRIAVLINPANANQVKAVESIQGAGGKRRVTILRADARNSQEIETAFRTMVRDKVGAVIVPSNILFNGQKIQIAGLALKHHLPNIAGDRIYAEAGCLMSYGSSIFDDFRRVATYVDKIFKVAKPADLPVEQPTKFELIINGKTAKSLSLTIPLSLLIMADKVI